MAFDWVAAGVTLGGQLLAWKGGQAADDAGKALARRARKAGQEAKRVVGKARGCVGGHSVVEVLEDCGDVLKYRCKRCGKEAWTK